MSSTRTRAHPGCACVAPRSLGLLVSPLVVGSAPRHRLPSTGMPAGPADLLVVGRLVTMNPGQPAAEALAVAGGRIVGIGELAELESLRGPATEVLELGDRVAYPGFVEPHMHLWASSMLDGWVDCSPMRVSSFDEIVARIGGAGPTRGEWTLGAFYDPSLVPGERELTRRVLDAAVPDRPVLVMNASLHYAYLNSRALELAGLTDESPDPPGGILGREGGRLTGALGEGPAMAYGLRVIPQAGQDAFTDAVVAVTARAAARGVTKAHEAATGMILGRAEVDLLHAISGRLATRASYAIFDGVHESILRDGVEPGAGDDMVRAVSWKIISDGSNQGRSGYQREPYLGRDDRGHPNHSVDYMAGQVALAHRLGWQVMIHANGDAAIDDVLDAYETGLDGASGLRRRDRIEHCSLPTDDQLARMASLGVSPSFLMNHVYYWGRAFADRIFGPDKAGRLDPVRSALRHGLRPSLHSDYAVTEIDPLRSVQTAVTRRVRDGGGVLNGDECISVDEAMRAVTIDAAWQIHADDSVGSLEMGKWADLVVLAEDPAVVDPDGIADIVIEQTLLGGRPTFERSTP